MYQYISYFIFKPSLCFHYMTENLLIYSGKYVAYIYSIKWLYQVILKSLFPGWISVHMPTPFTRTVIYILACHPTHEIKYMKRNISFLDLAFQQILYLSDWKMLRHFVKIKVSMSANCLVGQLTTDPYHLTITTRVARCLQLINANLS